MERNYSHFIRHNPEIEKALFISPTATIRGTVILGENVSVWHSAVLRGDMAPIEIGARTNIQDGAVLHVADDTPCVVGEDVTIGHSAIVHACKIGNRCLVGMGAIIMNGTSIGDECIIGAGAVIPGGKIIPSRSLVIGNPGKVVRSVTDKEVEELRMQARTYMLLAQESAAAGKLFSETAGEE